MKRGSISIYMVFAIIIALIAMTIFLIFFTGRSAGLFSSWKQVEPGDTELANNKCLIACNTASLTSNCEDWKKSFCDVRYGKTELMCWEKDFCNDVKKKRDSSSDDIIKCKC